MNATIGRHSASSSGPSGSGTTTSQGSDDAVQLLAELWGMRDRFPKATLAAEFATFGPLLNLLVGGRDGVDAHRHGTDLDTETFIPLYKKTFAAFFDGVPGEARLNRFVDFGARQDEQENANLQKAFDLLDPKNGDTPQVLKATRYAAPAAGHAAVKFSVLLPLAAALLPKYAALRARRG